MDADSARPRRNPPVGIDHPVQWVVCLLTAMLALFLLADQPRLDAPGAPATLLYAGTVASLAAAALNFPPLFFRLPHGGRWLCFAAVLVAAAIIGTAHAGVKTAWMKTAQGKQEAAAQAAVESQRAAAERAQQDADAAREKVAEGNRNLNACFSTFGHEIPKLSAQVKDGLENPASFEHVRTEAIGDSAAPFNVVLTFRGQNTFGAIRTNTLSAKINPADCSVEAVGNATD